MEVSLGAHRFELGLPALVLFPLTGVEPGRLLAVAKEAIGAGADAVEIDGPPPNGLDLPVVARDQVPCRLVVDVVTGRPHPAPLHGAEVAALLDAVDAGALVVRTDQPRSARRVLTVLAHLRSAPR